VSDVVWSSNGTLAATYTDGKVRVWDVHLAVPMSVIDVAPRGTPAVAFDPSGRRLAVGHGRTVRIRDVAARVWTAQWTPRSGTARSISWSPDGQRIAAAVSGNMFEVWDGETGETLLRLPQTASAWLVTWTLRHELVLVPLNETVRVLRAPAPAADPAPPRAEVTYLKGARVGITTGTGSGHDRTTAGADRPHAG
jgi:WD40 repeat protein